MSSPRIVFLDANTLSRGDLDLGILNRLGEITFHPNSSPSEVSSRIQSAEIVLTNKVMLDAKTLAESSKLRYIAICATGTDHVDLAAARQRGIHVSNVAGYSSSAVAQHTMAFILNWATQMHRLVQEPLAWSKSDIFTRLDYPTVDLVGKGLGVLGTGRIGSEVGRLAEAFGMTVRALEHSSPNSSPAPGKWERLPLEPLMRASDVISLHCPLTKDTHHIINAASLGWIKRGAFLVNTARGDLVDESALRDALLSGQLSGAGLDVLSEEPPSPHHPLIQLHHPNLMITPHSAWTTIETRRRLLHEVIANIEAFLNGKDRNRVA